MRRAHFSWAPQSSLALERRGRAVARFCRGCASFYPLHARLHSGKPSYGRDHVSSPCAYEGHEFTPGSSWWEAGFEVLPLVATAVPERPAGSATSAKPTA